MARPLFDAVSLMMHPRQYLAVLDRIGIALDATCAALMTLQSIDAISTDGDRERVGGAVAHGISHLRQAIDELRDAHMQGQTGLALGFVLAPEAGDLHEEGESR